MKVRFNNVEEYIEELQRDHPKLLRLTNVFEFTRGSSVGIRHLTVVATHLSADRQLVRLDRYVGAVWNLDVNERVSQAMRLAEGFQKEIRAAAKALKIEVRAGVIEP